MYNGEQYLQQSMESILTQEGVELEFIVVNDGSTDATHEILVRVAAQDSRVKMIRRENQGLTKALIPGVF